MTELEICKKNFFCFEPTSLDAVRGDDGVPTDSDEISDFDLHGAVADLLKRENEEFFSYSEHPFHYVLSILNGTLTAYQFSTYGEEFFLGNVTLGGKLVYRAAGPLSMQLLGRKMVKHAHIGIERSRLEIELANGSSAMTLARKSRSRKVKIQFQCGEPMGLVMVYEPLFCEYIFIINVNCKQKQKILQNKPQIIQCYPTTSN